jgi:hypothetical protein
VTRVSGPRLGRPNRLVSLDLLDNILKIAYPDMVRIVTNFVREDSELGIARMSRRRIILDFKDLSRTSLGAEVLEN